MSSVDQDSDFYSTDQDSTRSRSRLSSSSRASNFTTDDDSTHEQSSLSTLTSFDAYFLHASRPSRTSSNVFSQLVQPLSADEYAASLSRSFYPLPFSDDAPAPTRARRLLEESHSAHLPRYLLELAEGFNLLFYGFGSKRRALNDLAHACATRAHAHVLVLNAFQPSFSTRDIIAALARLPGAPQSVQGGIRRGGRRPQRRRLILVVHNMDAPALRAPKVRALLNALAALSDVQLAASVDHVNAPLLWTSTELLARRWLWHDLTTLAPYDGELAGADPASLRGVPASAGAGGGGAGGGAGQMMTTETAARHVLAAVTQRARKLFVLMGRRQLDVLADARSRSGGVVDPTTPAEAGEIAIPYDTLFNLARDQFVATNDTAIRALLGEFRDHGLVVTVGTGPMGSGEMLWIPLRKERLTKLLDELE
ncbi:origin recognition complex subunit 2-domain-containing protein [Russula compacta]|nr:origin recognition complex subunit 2-domain-containing protein [Russula compacta]